MQYDIRPTVQQITNPILIHPLLTPRDSTSNIVHHSRLTLCLPDSLDLTRCLSS